MIVAAFGAGIYFKDDAINYYNSFTKKVSDLKKADIGQIISGVQKQILTATPLNVGGVSNQVVLLQSKIIEQTNLERQQNGDLPALKENSNLDDAAAAKANDILKNQYFEHISPTGVDPGKLVQSYGYEYIVAGENLILGNFSSEKEVVQDWMNSPGHRANILNNRYSEIGVAIIKGKYRGEDAWVGVQEFGLPLSNCSEPNVSLKNQIDSEKSQMDNLSSEINDKKNQLNSTDRNSLVYSQMVDDYNNLIAQYNSLADQVKTAVSMYNDSVNNFNNCVAGK